MFRATAFAALALACAGGGGLAAEPPAPTDAASGGRNTVQVGAVTADPEKDSIGLPPGEHDECGLVPLFSRDAVLHGPGTGDPEKDSLGLRVVGHYDSCAGTSR